jgi:cytoskeleton protein RodZ
VTDTIDTDTKASAPPAPSSAGARLRAAREAAGLSIDAVAQQLKLAPRQVTALEEDDFQRLPGRTFVRGFARNYARFVQLDPDAVLALLPAPESAPSLERPTLAAGGRPMGELPLARVTRPSAARRLVPLLVVAIIAAAGFYEYTRHQRQAAALAPEPAAVSAPPVIAPAPTVAAAPASPGTLTTALPNPVAEAPGASAPQASASGAAPPSPSTAPAGGPAGSATAPTPAPEPSAAASANAALVLTFKGTSWAEVKDATGRVILQMTGGAGMTQTVSGSPPFELALGNAPDVGVTFRGQTLDLAPYTRGLVARVSLR